MHTQSGSMTGFENRITNDIANLQEDEALETYQSSLASLIPIWIGMALPIDVILLLLNKPSTCIGHMIWQTNVLECVSHTSFISNASSALQGSHYEIFWSFLVVFLGNGDWEIWSKIYCKVLQENDITWNDKPKEKKCSVESADGLGYMDHEKLYYFPCQNSVGLLDEYKDISMQSWVYAKRAGHWTW